VNELCRVHEHNLTLYAEGELEDVSARERVETHLRQCDDCQAWVREYREFTRDIAAELQWAAESVTRDPRYGSLTDAERVDAVMAPVHGQQKRRQQRSTIVGLAAALIVVALAGLLWRSFQPSTPHGNQEIAGRATGSSSPAEFAVITPQERDGIPDDLELISWLMGDAAAVHDASGAGTADVELLGVVRRYRRDQDGHWMVIADGDSSSVRWVLTARLREEFLDPLGGGWTFLVPDENEEPPAVASALQVSRAQASGAIPLRRVGLQSVSRQKPRYVTHRAANEGATRYRIIVVPDDRGLGEEIYLQPASKMPGGIFRDPMEALPTY